MRNKKICVFADELDCPKEAIHLTCEECEKHKHYETIEKAVEDFISLGDSFTDLFQMLKTMQDNDSKKVTVDIPAESIYKINRVMTTFLSSREQFTEEETIYRRLIFYFFSIVIDEFNQEEYTEDTFLN